MHYPPEFGEESSFYFVLIFVGSASTLFSFTNVPLVSDCEIRIMSSAKLQFRGSLTQTDPHVHPVVIIGQVKNLAKIKFSDIKVKLEPRITEEVGSHDA